ncbi:MAG: hypothetical protein ABIP30_03210 [Ferruginibacter sp.]
MLAYNKTALYNLFVRNQTSEAYEKGAVTQEEYAAVFLKYPSQLYTPNFFIGIALFLLTLIIVIFSIGILALMLLGNGSDSMITGLAIFFSAICFIGLEVFIKQRNHYHSGVDTALLCGAVILLISGIEYATKAAGLQLSIIIFIISLACTIRYGFSFMGVISFLSFLSIFFFLLSDLGIGARAIIPFVLMAISLFFYFLLKTNKNKDQLAGYTDSINILEITSLITLYAAGNFYIVKQMGDIMFSQPDSASSTIPFAFLFWIFTIVIPLVYLFFGIKNKDAILLRVGLLLIAAIIFTIRYYHTLMPVEAAMTLGGIIMVLVAWAITRYLHVPKNGFTSVETDKKTAPGKAQIEALLLAQTFSQTHVQNSDTKFGGGDFGGGGASGDF